MGINELLNRGRQRSVEKSMAIDKDMAIWAMNHPNKLLTEGGENVFGGFYNSRSPRNEVWPEKNENLERFSEFLSFAKKEMKIVTGGVYPAFYEDKRLITNFNKLLESEQTVIEIVFSKGSEDIGEAIEKLQKENPELFKLAREKKEQLKLYWVNERPQQHYAIIDGKHLFFEDPHKSGETRKTLFRVNDSILGKKWQERFNSYIENKAKLVSVEL